jgi:hypothetical protein
MSEQKIKMSPKDFFLYIAVMVTLYWSAISLIILWFEYIDRLFPDPLQFYVDPFSGAIRFAMASLIIVFPIYVYLTRYVNQQIRKEPEKRGLGIRRWLIFLALFIAGITIVGDLIALINTFLGGDLTTRFVLKVLVILVVAGAGFYYYLNDLRGIWEQRRQLSKIIGSPIAQRELRLDQERIENLQFIQFTVLQYWQETGKLPEDLVALNDPLRGYTIPMDPLTDVAYVYRPVGPLSFELCAIFDAPLPDTFKDHYPDWPHGVGETCFERTIDPERHAIEQVGIMKQLPIREPF